MSASICEVLSAVMLTSPALFRLPPSVLALTLPVLRSRGVTALPVTYIGKAATFALMSGFPLVLLGQWDALWSRVIGACGWGFVIWGLGMYLWSAVLYLLQVRLVPGDLYVLLATAAWAFYSWLLTRHDESFIKLVIQNHAGKCFRAGDVCALTNIDKAYRWRDIERFKP